MLLTAISPKRASHWLPRGHFSPRLNSSKQDDSPPPQARPAQRKRPYNVSILANKRILLVEDNPINQMIVKELLKSYGVLITIAQDGVQALSAVANNPPYDLVLMDIQMPNMDGYETTGHLRARPDYQDLPVIAMTAHALAEDREKCLQAGMNDYLAKPIKIELLLTTVIKWLS